MLSSRRDVLCFCIESRLSLLLRLWLLRSQVRAVSCRTSVSSNGTDVIGSEDLCKGGDVDDGESKNAKRCECGLHIVGVTVLA